MGEREVERVESEREDLVRIERSEGIIKVRVYGRTENVFQGRTRNEDEGSVSGLIFSLEGRHYCALTGKHIRLCKEERPRRLYVRGRLCMQRYDKFFPNQAGRAVLGQVR